ncbi:MAG: 5-formyltetrahydrofolate cyclo-ligase, partial [Spongiibacter marinus]|uniref:5-formyltetrahydrofolate cyclo-ligase n=1 Tax=Spongiibacter marinus TaxID=354246 RepID=UPI003C3D509F
MDASSKNQLRQRLRQQRRDLPAATQRRAAKRLLQQLRKLPEFRRARHIALYSASDGEISTNEVLRYCQQRGKVCYLPVIHRDTKHAQMRFHRHAPGQTLRSNTFNIPEPNALR